MTTATGGTGCGEEGRAVGGAAALPPFPLWGWASRAAAPTRGAGGVTAGARPRVSLTGTVGACVLPDRRRWTLRSGQ
eukprot:scaffold814_cov398-Prasinococcus_capsulatus_cf.AAC.1